MLLSMPRLNLDAVQVARMAQGQRLGLDLELPDGMLRLYAENEFIGLGELSGRRLAPSRLISSVARKAAQGTKLENLEINNSGLSDSL
jgi:tRNA pseudouridine55 synthase